MAILKGSAPIILIGIGAAVAAPLVIPAVATVGRPALKGMVKGILSISDRATEFLAEVGEQWSDLVAEARSEHAAATGAAAGLAKSKPRPAAAQV
jgi:hypothetical protein